MAIASDTGLDSFTAGLRRCGVESSMIEGVVTFTVEPFGSAHVGRSVQTGVGTDELTGWPLVPPHWVHLPPEVTFARSNTQASPIPGWLKHSRQINDWGNASEPAQAWIAHVRAVLREAV